MSTNASKITVEDYDAVILDRKVLPETIVVRNRVAYTGSEKAARILSNHLNMAELCSCHGSVL